jgi:hypothetical protein
VRERESARESEDTLIIRDRGALFGIRFVLYGSGFGAWSGSECVESGV